MKKICTTLIVTLIILPLLACGGNQKHEFTANAKGVAPVLLNLKIDKIPVSSGTLYDSFTTEKIADDFEGEYTILHFMQSDKLVMNAYMYGDIIELIEVFSPKIGSIEGIGPGTKVVKLFEKGGKPNMMNDGTFYIILGDIKFKVSGLKQSGDKKLEKAYAIGENPKITVEDFDSNAEVESISIF